jgi:hypothetical protein
MSVLRRARYLPAEPVAAATGKPDRCGSSPTPAATERWRYGRTNLVEREDRLGAVRDWPRASDTGTYQEPGAAALDS